MFNDGFTTLTLEGSAIDLYVASQANDLYLVVTTNCGTAVEYQMVLGDITQGATNQIVLEPADLGQLTSTFTEGVYQIYIEYRDTTVTRNKYYYYSNLSIPCQLIDLYSNKEACLETKPCLENISYMAYSLDRLLGFIGTCDDFTYARACQLWTKLNQILENSTDCGC